MSQPSPGPLMIIGGAEDKLRKRAILREFVAASGGADAEILVVPTASSLGPEIIEVYQTVFKKLGAIHVDAARPETREESHDPELVARVDRATGIFMTGGNQLKLSGAISGTPFGDAIVRAHRRGAVVGGTSAGASIQSSHMVAFGVGGATPKQRMTQVAAGLGLVDSAVIDQHFDQRNRYGRLLMIVAQSPQLLGIGVDEDTAAVVEHIDGHEVMRVIGSGAVTVFDPARMVTNAHEAQRSNALLASGVQLHVLPTGTAYDLTTRRLVPPPPSVDDSEAAEIAEAGRDLQQLARDIAASDVSPAYFRRRLARHRRGLVGAPPVRTAAHDPDAGLLGGPEGRPDGGPVGGAVGGAVEEGGTAPADPSTVEKVAVVEHADRVEQALTEQPPAAPAPAPVATNQAVAGQTAPSQVPPPLTPLGEKHAQEETRSE